VVYDGRAQDAGNDGQRLLETRCEDKRQQLRLVADFRECNHSGRDEESFHGCGRKPLAVEGQRLPGGDSV